MEIHQFNGPLLRTHESSMHTNAAKQCTHVRPLRQVKSKGRKKAHPMEILSLSREQAYSQCCSTRSRFGLRLQLCSRVAVRRTGGCPSRRRDPPCHGFSYQAHRVKPTASRRSRSFAANRRHHPVLCLIEVATGC